MKKKLLILLGAIGSSMMLNAQTITFANQAPTNGDSVVYEVVDIKFGFVFDPAGEGAVINKVWDARGDVENGFALTSKGHQSVNFNDPVSTTFGASFPSATTAVSFTGVGETDGYEYYSYTGNNVVRYSFVDNTKIIIDYENDAFNRYEFPMAPGDQWNYEYEGYYGDVGLADSAKVENGTYTAVCQAVGKLLLPSLTFGGAGEQFNDVLLVHSTETFDISLYIVGAAFSSSWSEEYYAYFKEGIQEPLLIYYETTVDNTAIGGDVTTTRVMKYQGLTGLDPTDIGENYTKPLFNVYPNPVNDKLTITIDSQIKNGVAVNIINTLGESVMSSNNVIGNTQLDVSSLEAGMYFVKVIDGTKEDVKKIIIK